MRVWLVTIGEPLPTDHGSPRLLRAGIVAGLLRDAGHEVVWWTSRFDHHAKLMRPDLPVDSRPALGYEIRMLSGCGYASNVSLRRLRDHRQVARAFTEQAGALPAPDVVLSSYPPSGLCQAAVDYGLARGIPVALDLRDLWPDIFVNLAPAPLQPLARWLLKPMFRASQRACAGAAALVGITDAFVEWGVDRAGRARREADRAFPLAYDMRPLPADKLQAARDRWTAQGVPADGKAVCFFGTLGRQFDIPTVLHAARRLKSAALRIVICGVGDRLEQYQREAADLPNVVFAGWVDAAAIRSLMERSLAGLAPYYNERSFTMSIPNKAVEYLAGGLPVLTCLTGELQTVLRRNDCGLFWAEGDAQSLADAIGRLVTDDALQRRLADNAAATFARQFVAQDVYGQLIDHLHALARAAR